METRPSDFRLGPWLVQPRLNRLRDGQRVVQVEPKVMDLLCFLASQPRQVQSKALIEKAVWGSSFVADSAVSRAVSELRRQLGDDAQSPTYVETLPKLGYRLLLVPEEPSTDVKRARLPLLLKAAAAIIGVAALALALLALYGDERGATEAPARLRVEALTGERRQITDDASLEIYPAFSPDGTRLAYAADRSGSMEIYVRQLGPGSPDLQLTDGGNESVQPAWSPDGSRIAFHSLSRGGLWLVPALGGKPRRLTDFGSRPDWAPDGESIVFQSYSGVTYGQHHHPAMPPSTLWRVRLEGSAPDQITEQGWPVGGHADPRHAPDGRLAFVSWDLDGGRVWLRDGAGKTKQLPGIDDARDVTWSAEGSELYYTLLQGGEPSLWAVPISPTELAATAPPRLLRRSALQHLAVSPGGDLVAGTRYRQSSNLWALPVDATGAPAGEARPLTDSTRLRNTGASFSPDGSRIAWSTTTVGQPNQIWTMAADGSGAAPLTAPDAPATGPAWLPSGDALLFKTWHAYSRRLRRIDLDSRQPTTLLEIDQRWKALRPSPDGRRVAFYIAPTSEPANVWVADIGGEPRQVTHEERFAGFPAWSPDGRWLAVEISRDRSTQLALVPSDPAPAAALRVLTTAPGNSWPGAWSPDGRHHIFVAQRDGQWSLRVVATGGGRDPSPERVVFAPRERGVFLRSPDWSPDGRRVVFELGQATGDVWTIDLLPAS